MTTATNPGTGPRRLVSHHRARRRRCVCRACTPKLRRHRGRLNPAASVAAIFWGAAARRLRGPSDQRHRVRARHAGHDRTRCVSAADDVMTVQVGTDPALRPVPACRASTVVGERAATDIAAGTLVTVKASATRSCPRWACRSWVWDVRRSQMPGSPCWSGTGCGSSRHAPIGGGHRGGAGDHRRHGRRGPREQRERPERRQRPSPPGGRGRARRPRRHRERGPGPGLRER